MCRTNERTIRPLNYSVKFRKIYHEIQRDLAGSGYKPPPFGYDSFKDYKPSHGCDKFIIWCYRWHGEWTGPVREIYEMWYRPKSA